MAETVSSSTTPTRSDVSHGYPPVSRPRTRLEITLMCLLARGANTGNGLVRILRECPIGGHGQSPGAVYPALQRLEEAEFVQARLRKSSGRRLCGRARKGSDRRYFPKKRHREYVLTYRGLDELRRWARAPVTRADMLERPDFLLLRYMMIPGLIGAGAARRFLDQYRRVARGVATDTLRYLGRFGVDRADAERDMSETVRLAFHLTIDLMRTRRRWAGDASRRGRRPGRWRTDDSPRPARRTGRAGEARSEAGSDADYAAHGIEKDASGAGGSEGRSPPGGDVDSA